MGWFSRSNDDRQEISDQQALDRYRYMLRTAPPEMIEQAHEEAFARLTPEQRQMALQQLSAAAPPQEQRFASDDPKSLARLATRAEIRQPGVLERLFGSVRPGAAVGGTGAGFGSMLAGSLLASVAGTFIGSAIAHSFFDSHPYAEGFDAGGDQAGVLDPAEDPQAYDEASYTGTNDATNEDFDSDFDGGDFGDLA